MSGSEGSFQKSYDWIFKTEWKAKSHIKILRKMITTEKWGWNIKTLHLYQVLIEKDVNHSIIESSKGVEKWKC